MTTSSLASTATERPRFAFASLVALVALLIAEVLYLTISFDTKTLDRAPNGWARLIGAAPQFLQLAIAVAGVTLLLGGKNLLSVLERNARLNPRWSYFLTGHLLALALFARVTATVMSRGFPSTPHEGWWALGWLLAGVLMLVLWALTMWPWSVWLEVVQESRWAILWGSLAGTAAWGTGFFTEEFWRPLAGYTFTVVRWMVGLIYAETFADPGRLEVGTPTFSVGITPQCSGYEGIGLIVAFLAAYLWLSRKTLRFPNALILLPIGAAAVWILNSVRIATLIVIGTSGWPQIALGGFHSQAGWLAFNAVGLGLVAITIRGRYFATTSTVANEAVSADHDPTSAYLGPFLAIVAASMITGAMSAGFDWLYPVRVIAAAAVLWRYRHTYAAMRWSWSWPAIAIGAVTFVIWLALMPAGANAKAGWATTLGAINPVWAGIWLSIRALGYVVTVPLAEELAFRGFALARLQRVDFQNAAGDFAWLPWIVSSVLFGAMHGSMWLAGGIAGLLFGLALFRRRSLGDAVQAHATTNLLLVIYAVTTGRWSAWS